MTGLLVANRGEVAVRVVRAARTLGLRTVAVYSPEDANGLHAHLADEAHPLSARGAAAYLDAAELVHHARRAGCTLVHPGYGFLSESAGFARACAAAGLTFVGPSPDVLDLFGDKTRARALAEREGVPVLGATAGPTGLAEARAFLDALGPGAAVMVKAVHGGGGRGTRVVRSAAELPEAFERARSEAERAFGNGALYVEQLLEHARHVEVQVVGDGTAVVSLGERECSVQRRHQKLVEVAPSPSLTPQLRDGIVDAALRMARATSYTGLGTFEFLLGDGAAAGAFFLEANPRLQVEHTVTEEVTGLDLVATQLEIAAGATLADVGLADPPAPRGWAVQARVVADGVGTVTRFDPPTGPGVRVDTHVRPGLDVTGAFDPLLAKVVTHTARGGFAAAADHAAAALAELALEGPATNLALLRAVLRHPAFRDGSVTTSFVDDHLADLTPPEQSPGKSAEQSPERSAAEPGPGAGRAPAGSGEDVVAAPFTGTVVALEAGPGDTVPAGSPVVVLEAMKMQHPLPAPSAGTVAEVLVAVGDTVAEGEHLLRLHPAEAGAVAGPVEEHVDPDHVRADLAEVVARHRATLDEARPEAVEKRHRSGRRTARENVADLCDDFTEYGALVVAAQRQRRSLEDLVANTPADGMVTGIGTVNADTFGEEAGRCVVMAYDYTVLAGTQGLLNHRKTDRMLELAAARRLPVVLFAEGGGGRPGDTDTTSASALDVPTFASMGRLSGRVPTVGIAAGNCFAGNAALLGCCDVVIATEDATIGMGGPAMIEGGGLGSYRPEEVGPVSVQVPNGVVDVLVADEAEAVEVARRYLSYFQGPVADWECADQRLLRHALPEDRVRVYDVRRVVSLLADEGSVLELRPSFGAGVVTALVRVEGRAMGLVANDPAHLGGAIDTPAADKLARFLQLCDAHGLPVLSLVDTPGFMVGPDAERTATVRHVSRLFVAGANLRVPLLGVVVRKGYGLGAMAMVGGGFHEPVAMVSWPTGEIGGMGLEGAVRLGFRRELDVIEDAGERQRAFDELLAAAYDRGKAVNAASVFELDDVIDPAETRRWVRTALTPPVVPPPGGGRRFVDTW